MTDSLLGASVQRLEDDKLLRGEGRFVDDIVLPNQLIAGFVRSPYSHAVINSIDTSAAQKLPGVHAVYTLADIRPYLSDERIRVGLPSSSYRLDVNPRVLADDEVVYVGEPIAVVIGESRYIVEDAAELVFIDFDLLPAVEDCRKSIQSDSATVHKDLPHNEVARFDFKYGDVGEAFSQAPHVLGASFWLCRGGSHSIEGRGVNAQYTAHDDHLTVWSSTQRPKGLQRLLCDLLERDGSDVRVIAPDIGGGFGPKLICYPEEVVVALLSTLTQRPVKWTEDRYEHFQACTQERDQYWDVEIAVDSGAKILGVRGALLHDHGAYTARGLNVPYASAVTLPLPYNIPAYQMDVKVALTNKVPVTPVRGAGQPQAVFVMERLMDKIAAELSIDRAEVRRRNLVTAEQMPCKKPLKLRGGTDVMLDSGDYLATQAQVLQETGWDEFHSRQQEALGSGRYIGIGLANYVEGTGRGPYEPVTVRIMASGNISIATCATAMGQGTDTMLAQIVAEQLGKDLSAVVVTSGDSASASVGFGGFNSRQTVIAGASAHAAAKKVREKLLHLASHLLEEVEEELELAGTCVRSRADTKKTVEFKELARAAAGLPGFKLPVEEIGPSLEATECVIVNDMAFSNGSAVAEVEVDIETGHVEVQSLVLAHDCGRMINPKLVEGQLIGGIAHGISNALFERMGFDETAQPITITFADYLLVTAAEMPGIRLFHNESPSPLNALGVKGVGESGVIPVIAAIASAVENALAPFGINIDQAPLTPSVLWNLIHTTCGATAHWRADSKGPNV